MERPHPTSLASMLASILFCLLNLGAVAFGTVLPFEQWPHQRVAAGDVSIHLRYYGSGPPVLLVHGSPQHSLTWHTIGPILAQNYTVIAPDNRGQGDSSVPYDNDFTAESGAEDLKAVLDFLGVNETYVFAHDKGVGLATALTAKYPSRVKRLGVAEYPLPGFGYETFWAPTSAWDLYQNWQLAFFSVPDAAEFFVAGRVREMLVWYFFHSSYSGYEAVSAAHLDRYTAQISKPGFLRAMFGYFAARTVAADNAFFNSTVGASPLTQPVLALGGEASFAPASVIQEIVGPIGTDVTADVVPKAGHWIADENPTWVADRLFQFFGEDEGIPTVDLSWLTNKVTLV